MDMRRKCVAILGIRGSGKSNTAKVITKELIQSGIPVTIIDPDGEYIKSFEEFGVMPVNSGTDPITQAVNDHRNGNSGIIDMSEWKEDNFEYLLSYISTLWEISRSLPSDRFIVVEEAHEFVPQNRRDPIGDVLTRIALRGRKRGLGMILVSQRSAKVNKDVLTQSEFYYLHKVVHPADLKVYKEILPIRQKEIERVIPSLQVGEAIYYSNGVMKYVKVPLFEESLSELNPMKEMAEI
ncbi:hypothetical protein HS7_04520 [Sulfolobales archaeon HS-7]|nr:hypothetical protein HS7_04520 [Sulfolobales archaeon HS-7]